MLVESEGSTVGTGKDVLTLGCRDRIFWANPLSVFGKQGLQCIYLENGQTGDVRAGREQGPHLSPPGSPVKSRRRSP